MVLPAGGHVPDEPIARPKGSSARRVEAAADAAARARTRRSCALRARALPLLSRRAAILRLSLSRDARARARSRDATRARAPLAARRDARRGFSEHFFSDFGPLNLACVVRYCRMVEDLLEAHPSGRLVHYCSPHAHRRANSACLLGCAAVIVLGRDARARTRRSSARARRSSRTATRAFGVCTYPLLVLDVVRGVRRALALGHLDYRGFDVDECAARARRAGRARRLFVVLPRRRISRARAAAEARAPSPPSRHPPRALSRAARPDRARRHLSLSRKFIAFSGPLARRREVEPGLFTLAAEDYVPIFKQLGVTCVVRFNKKCYDRRKFVDAGIRHVDLYYEDGANPTEDIMQRFLQLCEAEPGAIAVHCKAGSRTGTQHRRVRLPTPPPRSRGFSADIAPPSGT